jgi:hypothetical protein
MKQTLKQPIETELKQKLHEQMMPNLSALMAMEEAHRARIDLMSNSAMSAAMEAARLHEDMMPSKFALMAMDEANRARNDLMPNRNMHLALDAAQRLHEDMLPSKFARMAMEDATRARNDLMPNSDMRLAIEAAQRLHEDMMPSKFARMAMEEAAKARIDLMPNSAMHLAMNDAQKIYEYLHLDSSRTKPINFLESHQLYSQIKAVEKAKIEFHDEMLKDTGKPTDASVVFAKRLGDIQSEVLRDPNITIRDYLTFLYFLIPLLYSLYQNIPNERFQQTVLLKFSQIYALIDSLSKSNTKANECYLAIHGSLIKAGTKSKSHVICKINAGTTVKIIERKREWIKVSLMKDGNEIVGWSKKKYFEPIE